MGAKQIATDIGISRNAVYQHIERLRRQGALAETYTPSGQPPRRLERRQRRGSPPRRSRRARARSRELRELAAAGADPDDPEYARGDRGRDRRGDAVGLAYELGRLDAAGEPGLPVDLVESALRRLSVLPLPDVDADPK